MNGKTRILVVDDDQTILEVLKRGLEDMGYTVDTADNNIAVKRVLALSRPDVILMDVSMPGLDGISLCRDLRLSPGTSDIPVIMVTAYSDDRTVHDAMLFGASDYVTKPFDLADIQKKIKQSLSRVQKKKEENS